MDGEDNQPLTDWQVRIREASTPDELLRIAAELRMRSVAAQKNLLAETRRDQAAAARGNGDDRAG